MSYLQEFYNLMEEDPKPEADFPSLFFINLLFLLTKCMYHLSPTLIEAPPFFIHSLPNLFFFPAPISFLTHGLCFQGGVIIFQSFDPFMLSRFLTSTSANSSGQEDLILTRQYCCCKPSWELERSRKYRTAAWRQGSEEEFITRCLAISILS